MSSVRYFLIGAVTLFGAIGYMGYTKRSSAQKTPEGIAMIQEIAIPEKPLPKVIPPPQKTSLDTQPECDKIHQLFALDSSKLPIVETISYTSRVPWLKGRSAWISDYASHFETSRHFIARSLNKKVDYFSQKVGPGDRFNVFKKDKNIRFHLLIDLSKAKMQFSYIDVDANEKVLLKTYRVGIGRVDPQKKSGYLTPVGKYELGDRIAIYKPGTMGFFQDKKSEMIRIFGTRWIPFEKEIDGCSEPAKGLGIHGAPFIADPATGLLVEDKTKIGKSDSDGCIRLSQEDMEELFAIVITKPTTIELVQDSKGVEK